MKQLFFALALLMSSFLSAQTFHLSTELKEISGIEFLNDTTIVAHNDGGQEPCLYLLDLNGKILKNVEIENAENVDWEDITVDENFVYVGDIGNNKNLRKDLVIYKVKISELFEKEKVTAEKIELNYKEQTSFPPEKKNLRFDAEALTIDDDTLYIFTKNRARPNDGNAWVYQVPTKAGKYTVSKYSEVFIGKGGFWADALTAADKVGDEFFLMTYNRVLIKKRENGEFVGEENIHFKTYSQKEALVVKSKMEIFVADEKQVMLGGPRMYRIEVNDLRDEK